MCLRFDYISPKQLTLYHSVAPSHALASDDPRLEIRIHTLCSSTKSGTIGSFSLVKCSCSKREHMLVKLAMENTLMEADVSFSMFIFLWVK